MRMASKALSVVLLYSVLLVACGAVTPMATSVVTQRPVSSPLPSITPLSPLILSPSNGPEKDISSYQLRTWTEDNYAQIEQSLDNLVGENDGQFPSLMAPDYSVAFQSEHLLSFPRSSNRNEILWDILFNRPETVSIPGSPSTNDLMSLLISGLLAHNTQPADLSNELEKYDVHVINTITIKNIIGNEEDGLVLLISMHKTESLTGVFVVFHANKEFHTQKIRDWEISEAPAMGRYFEIYDVGDTNNNSLPEVVIQVQTGGSGIPQTWKESIDRIEWSPQNRAFQSESVPVFWQTCDDFGQGPCEGDWEFSTIESQHILTTKSHWSTRNDCPYLTIQRVFVWDGTQYALENPEIVSPNDDLTPECRLAWAETAIWMPASFWDSDIKEPGWNNDLAISIIEKNLTNWPKRADDIWGPASRDYFKLQLGMWYEVRNEAEKAKFILKQIANKPYRAEYDFMSRLASIYLQERASFGRVKACLKLEDTYFEELRQTIPELSPYNNDEAMLKAWGIVDRKGSFCDIYDILSADVKDARLISPNSLMQWLEKSELTVYQKESIDLNNDNLEDYLILLDTTNSANPDPWIFLTTAQGYQAIYVSGLQLENEQSKLNIRSIKIASDAPAYLLLSDGNLVVFRFTPDLTIRNLIEEYGVQSIEIDDEVPLARILVHIDNYYDGQKNVIYLWNPNSQNFIAQVDDFVNAQAEIERLLYMQEDYQGVIKFINGFLKTAPLEPKRAYVCGIDIPDGCKYLPDWYFPYFRYLSGVAHERVGQIDEARQTYYELWRDFSKNVFGMAASLKLVPVTP